MSTRIRRRGAAAALALCVAIGLSACGSSDETANATQGTSDEIKTQAAQLVSTYTKQPTSIGVTEPVKGQIPAGKRIAYMNTGLSSAVEIEAILKEALTAVGWELVSVNVGLTPEKLKAGWEQAVRLKPDGVIGVGFGPEYFSPELDQLKAMNIPVVEVSLAKNDPRLTALFQGVDDVTRAGEIQAAWTLAQHGSDAKTVAVDVPDLESVHAWFTGFSNEYKRLCPNCKLDKIQFAATDMGTPKTASQLAGYVQAHPDTNTIMMAVASLALGLPDALAPLGYKGSIGVLNADEAIRDYMRKGQVTVSNSTDWATTVWLTVDTLARAFLGESVQPDLDAPLNYYLYTGENIPAGKGYATAYVADYQAQFKKLWGKS